MTSTVNFSETPLGCGVPNAVWRRGSEEGYGYARRPRTRCARELSGLRRTHTQKGFAGRPWGRASRPMSPIFERWLAIAAGVVTIAGFFLSLYFLPSQHATLAAGISLASLALLGGLGGFALGRKFPAPHTGDSDQHLVAFFERKRAENDNAAIVRFGLALSRPLWLSHKYPTRRQIGEFVRDAAAVTGDIGATIRVLIDDIGWTNVELGKFDAARTKLELGVELAIRHNRPYYVAKGRRHQFALNYRRGDLDTAERFLALAIEATEAMHPSESKDELLAEVHFAKSSLELKRGNLEKSLLQIEIAQEMYATLPDKEWPIKILARKGEILLAQGKIEEATEVFRRGYNEAKGEHLNRQEVKNLIGLGRCAYESRTLQKAKQHFDDALKLAESVGMFHEKSLIAIEQAKLEDGR